MNSYMDGSWVDDFVYNKSQKNFADCLFFSFMTKDKLNSIVAGPKIRYFFINQEIFDTNSTPDDIYLLI